jgi:UDP-3-O-[3-hydroxymyristoyl] N-acetylglucosamine deacetylase/3-hydroxyacyl-[acyl-carrier-protein] dehydratase
MVKQKTIANEISLKGVGLHTGQEVTITFKPAPVNNGFTFVRVDLEGQPIIEADANYVVNTQRGTNIEKRGVMIQTPEHVLAAIVGCDLDNIIIDLNASELPIMDGSSKYFVEAIENAGIVEQDAERKVFIVKEVISYLDEATGSEITVIPSEEYCVTTMVDFGTKVLGTQNATMRGIKDFKTEIADCRTFSFLHELEALLNNGLIKGGDLNNAIVYVDKEISAETMENLKRAFNKDTISSKSSAHLHTPLLIHSNSPMLSKPPHLCGPI